MVVVAGIDFSDGPQVGEIDLVCEDREQLFK